MLQAGAVLARSYRLLHTIGEGGMGRVWVAEQLALDRRVAVKVLSDEGIQSKPALELFHREARATARVDSPHVVRVLDFDVTEQGFPFLVLELLVGETLEERVLRMGALPLDDARAILEQTCHALAAAHGCGILHRDIKAENLFLQAGRRVDVKLLDFGIALMKYASAGPRQMGPVGTPQYMSPEQMLGHDVDERSDLFSLGVCIYHALTGAFPYPGRSCAEIGCALSTGTFLPPSAYRLGLPRGVDEWFAKAIAVRVEERFTSPSEMLEAFESAISPSTRDTPVSIELDLEGLHEGWPSAVWKAIGAVAALSAVAVTVHAGMVERRATRALAAVAETHTTSAVIEASATIPPPPLPIESAAAPAPASPPSKAIAAQPKKKARPRP
ncbi:MAG TPA: serine/threonine-protein kinase [Polyangiaceae bacterium]|jgi:serine/threonine-protein kinase|nr:serine/threonine-protein kinase [Polyangiaceae bacterium]